MKRIITIEAVKEAVEAAHAHFREEKSGKNADYIPYLKNVPSDLFGISVCLADGRSVTVGDTDYRFGIESVSKVPTAILAMNQYSAKKVLSQIGADATGLPFNSIMAILLENDHPSTPLVNAGAISACSMIKPTGNAEAKWKAIVDFISGLCGSKVSVLDELYRSESETNFNNRSIAWLLKSYNRIYDDPDMSLDLYTRQCSLGITAKQLAVMAATIANCGTNPVTWEEVFHPNLTPAHRFAHGHRRLLRAYGRLALQHGASGQNGRRRRHYGRHPRRNGPGGVRASPGQCGQLGQGTEGARIHLRTAGSEHFQPRARRTGGGRTRQRGRLQITARAHNEKLPTLGVGSFSFVGTYRSRRFTVAGLPAASESAGISRTTTLPAATTERSPIVTPGQTTTPPPSQQSSPIVMRKLVSTGRRRSR